MVCAGQMGMGVVTVPASTGPAITKTRGPIRAAKPPTGLANRNETMGLGRVDRPAAVAE